MSETVKVPVIEPGIDPQVVALLGQIANALTKVGNNTQKATEATERQEGAWKRATAAWQNAKNAYGDITGVIGQVRALVDTVTQAAAAHERLQRIQTGTGLSFQATQDALSGFVDTQVLADQAGRMLTSRISTTQESFTAFARIAQNYSRNSGKELRESFEGLHDALATGSAEGLARYGIRLEDVGGASASAAERMQHLVQIAQGIPQTAESASSSWNRLLNEFERGKQLLSVEVVNGLRDAGNSAEDGTAKFEKIRWVIEKFVDGVGAFISVTGEIVRFLTIIHRSVYNVVEAFIKGEGVLGRFKAGFMALVGTIGEGFGGPLGRFLTFLGVIPERATEAASSFDRVATSATQATAPVDTFTTSMTRQIGGSEGLTRSLTALADQYLATRDAAAVARGALLSSSANANQSQALYRNAQGRLVTRDEIGVDITSNFQAKSDAEGQAMRRRASGSGSTGPTEAQRRALEALRAYNEAVYADVSTAQERLRALTDAYNNQVYVDADEQRSRLRTQIENYNNEVYAEVDRNRQRRLEQGRDAQANRMDLALERAFGVESLRSKASVVQGFADTVKQAWDGIGEVVSKNITLMATGQLSFVEGLKAMGAQVLSTLGDMAIKEGTMYVLKGTIATALGLPTGPVMLAGGAALIALGAGMAFAGAKAAPATPSKGASGGTSPTAVTATGSAQGGGSGGNMTVVNNYYAPVIGGREASRWDVGDQLTTYQPRNLRAQE